MHASRLGTVLRVAVASIRDFPLGFLRAACVEDDLVQAAARLSGKRREQFLLGRLLVRQLLPPGDWRIQPGTNGRPSLFPAASGGRYDLSISHSGEWAAAAVTNRGTIGIDIETPRPGRSVQAIAEVCLSEAERRVVSQEGEPAFLAFWTLREAVAKGTGEGMSAALALDGEALIPARGGSVRVRAAHSDWVVAHRGLRDLQLALSWSGVACGAEAEAEAVVEEALSRACAGIPKQGVAAVGVETRNLRPPASHAGQGG